jgi:hypothetical protein
MATSRPTADDIRALRDSGDGGGLQECKASLLREWRRARLDELRSDAGELYTVAACNDVIRDLIDFMQQVERDSDSD